MLRLRTIGSRVLLGWLAAEWFGMLLAYGFMLLTLGFLISYILWMFPIGSVWYIPPVVVMVGFGIYLAVEAGQIPREMMRRAVAPLTDGPPAAQKAPSPSPLPTPVVWESRPLVSRIRRVSHYAFATGSGGMVASASARDETRPIASRWVPDLIGGGGAYPFSPDGRVPAETSPLRAPGAVHIVDLSEAPRPRTTVTRPPPTG